MNAICFVIDRLHAGYLGAYGNSWIETPSFDRLASRSLVFDRAVVDSPCLERLYRSYWQGWHALCPPPPETRPGLAALLREAGVSTALLTDDPKVARHPLAVDFDELVEIDPPWQPHIAGTIEQTHFARCFVEILHWLEEARGPFLLWCHLGGLGTTWDAPLKFRQAYWEQGDPQPPNAADVPDRMLPPNHDPDELLGITQSYAGQMTLLDTCFGAMLEFLDGLDGGRLAEETLLTLTSSRGFPLGEHRRVGPCDNALYGELVHVPWMMQFPGGRKGGGRKGVRNHLPERPEGCFAQMVPDTFSPARSQALVEPADLWATLLDCWGEKGDRSNLPEWPEGCVAQIGPIPFFPTPTACSLMPIVREEGGQLRDRLCIAGSGHERAIRTPAWHLRIENQPEFDSPPKCQLFAKPDDRWEVNDVASRCRDVVEGLQDTLTQYEQALPAGRIADLPPLSDVLRNGME